MQLQGALRGTLGVALGVFCGLPKNILPQHFLYNPDQICCDCLGRLLALGMEGEHWTGSLMEVQDPLRQYALPRISAASLAQFRRVSRASKLLVDQHTGDIWKAAASKVVEPACLPAAEHGHAVQSHLLEQSTLLQAVQAGKQLPL